MSSAWSASLNTMHHPLLETLRAPADAALLALVLASAAAAITLPPGWSRTAQVNVIIDHEGHALIYDSGGSQMRVAPSSLTLNEQGGSVVVIPVSPFATVTFAGRPATLSRVGRGNLASTVRVDGAPAEQVRARRRGRSRVMQNAETRALHERYRRDGDLSAREELIVNWMPLVNSLARRYVGRGERFEDLCQVGMIGLDQGRRHRFDPARGFEFSTPATPTVLGEIERHFRDYTARVVSVPRPLQGAWLRVHRQSEALTGNGVGHAPDGG